MAEVRFVVFIHAIGGDEGQRDLRILLTNIFHQLAGREARADDDDAITHFNLIRMYSRVRRGAKCRTISSALSVLLAKMSLTYWRRRQNE